MTKPIAVQLYTLREQLEKEFETVCRRLGSIGYIGVETADLPRSLSPVVASRILKNAGLEVAAAHLPLPLGDEKNQVIETAQALGSPWIVSGAIDRHYFTTLEGILSACDRFNEAASVASQYGFKFAIHNHWWEFEMVSGRFPYQVMLENLDPAVYFELDAYWIQVAGRDPYDIVVEFGNRAPLLHVKDGPAEDSESDMVAVGDGKVHYPEIIHAAGENIDWLIVELDRCATDMMAAVERSFTYLTRKGLAHGK